MTRALAIAALILAPAAALAQDLTVEGAYARALSPMAGSAFMRIVNDGDTDDRLIGVETDAADRAELHTHEEGDGGVVRMIHVEQGFPVPAGETLSLARGGDHVMLMGFAEMPEPGDELVLTLTFEQAGEVEVTVPVDNERQPDDHAH